MGKYFWSLVFAFTFTIPPIIALPPDSLCQNFIKTLPEFPVLKEARKVTFLPLKHEVSQKPLFSIVTNRELIAGKNGLTFSDNCHDGLYYISVFRRDTSYYIQLKNSLADLMSQEETNKQSLVYVHGYGRTFNTILREGELIKNFYNIPLVLFDWPSKYPGIFELKSYLFARKNLKKSLPAFNQFLKEYNEFALKKEIASTLLLHSMGNMFLEKTIKQKSIPDCDSPVFNKIILNAAAVRKRGHRKWLACQEISEDVYVITNKKDPTLFGVYWLTLRKQLGRSQFRVKSVKGIHYVNLGDIAKGHHNYFINERLMSSNPSLKLLYFKLLTSYVSPKHKNCSSLITSK